jgi:tripartite-type tricarboxylate transporter receptor subunit TctC
MIGFETHVGAVCWRRCCSPRWAPASAQEWPVRTIRAIVPLTAGSATDIVARTVLEQVARAARQARVDPMILSAAAFQKLVREEVVTCTRIATAVGLKAS